MPTTRNVFPLNSPLTEIPKEERVCHDRVCTLFLIRSS